MLFPRKKLIKYSFTYTFLLLIFILIRKSYTTKMFTVTSKSFTNKGPLPIKYSTYGDDVNPELSWTNVPEGTKSFCIINDDPDGHNWVHWLVKNIPADVTSVPEDTVPGEEVVSSWRIKKYKGPRPPSGTHRYFFKVYALKIEKMKANNIRDFYKEAEANKLAVAEIYGTFSSQN